VETERTNISVKQLREFTTQVFSKLGVPTEDAQIVSDVLITADQRGIASHGMQRLKRYVNGIKVGIMKPIADIRVLKETACTLFISGGDGLGQVVGYRAMEMAIKKALQNNLAIAVVRDSNHYGIASYYSLMALKHGLIGISLTNSEPLVVPTYGKDALIGTNPISIAVPAGEESPFVLDMATSTVPRGKVEVYERAGKKINETWATDELGRPTQDPSLVLANIREGKGGGLLPLGGAGEEGGGHKGYGLCLAVDLFCGVLSGSLFGRDLYSKEAQSYKTSHFFGAIKIDSFIDPDQFKKSMDIYIRTLQGSAKAEGSDRIFVHGEKEAALYAQNTEEVPLLRQVIDEIRKIGREVNVEAPF
jgi:L-2-hydroxycarboxylate dehydrogenase (NAD+)